MTVYLQFMLHATLPPHYRSDHGGYYRHEHQKDPAQPAQPVLVECKDERLRDFWRDADELLPAEQPVHAARDEIESLLILRDRIVLNKRGVANHYKPRGVHLYSLICAAAFFNRRTNR